MFFFCLKSRSSGDDVFFEKKNLDKVNLAVSVS